MANLIVNLKFRIDLMWFKSYLFINLHNIDREIIYTIA